MRALIPYSEFTLQELNVSIRHARESIQRLALEGCARSMRSIEILRDNIRQMEAYRNALDT